MGNIRMASFAALVLVALLCNGAWADMSIGTPTTLPATIKPGVSGTVVLAISNPDQYDALGVLGEAFGTDNVQAAGQTFLGDFKPGVGTTLTFPFSVPSETKAGTYSIRYRLSWTNVNGSRFKTIYVPITVSNPPIFSIQGEDKTVYTNDDFMVGGRITNQGGPARNVRLLAVSDKFIQTGQTPLWVGEINQTGNFSIGFTLAPGVTSGRYSIPITAVAEDESGQETTSNLTLRITVNRKAPDFTITATPEKPLTPGEKVSIMVEIANIGDDEAYSTRISLSGDSAITPLSRTDYDIGDLQAGKIAKVRFDVGVNDVTPGFYQPDFVIHYHNKDGDIQPQKNISAGVNVEGKNDVSVFVSAKPSPLVAGGAHTLSVLVSNIGSSPIKALSVKIGGDFFQLQEAQGSQFIGGLNQDDFSTVQYKIRVRDDLKDGNYPFNVSMMFKDAYNREQIVEREETLNIISKETAAKLSSNSGGISPVVMVAVAAVVLLAAYFGWKRMRGGQKK